MTYKSQLTLCSLGKIKFSSNYAILLQINAKLWQINALFTCNFKPDIQIQLFITEMIMINYKTKTSLFVSTYIVLILFDTFRVHSRKFCV